MDRGDMYLCLVCHIFPTTAVVVVITDWFVMPPNFEGKKI